MHGFSIWKFIKYIKEELLIVLGTSSSESVLPRMMAKMENLGAKKSVVGLVITTGNGVATVVVAKWTGDLDSERMTRHLNQETDAEADEPEVVLDAVTVSAPKSA